MSTESQQYLKTAEEICDKHIWDVGALYDLDKFMGIKWYLQGTREQIVMALCFLAAMRA